MGTYLRNRENHFLGLPPSFFALVFIANREICHLLCCKIYLRSKTLGLNFACFFFAIFADLEDLREENMGSLENDNVKSGSRGLLSRSNMTHDDHPLSLGQSSVWNQFFQTGPPQYRSSTIFEDATPEMVKDFFWDDEFRFKWDDMLIHHATLEECTATGIMIVHWVRKFPFFCSDREYVIGRRIWESDGSYYCVTKGVHYLSLRRQSKPRRVDIYYSSWCIRPAESRKDGQMSACEVLLFHHEDMGIPWEIAKLGVRQGMWGAVKKIDPGLRAYQKERACGAPLSRSATMAHKITKVSPDKLRFLEESEVDDLAVVPVDGESSSSSSGGKQCGLNLPKVLVVGGAVAVACTLDKGLLTKALIFGVARRFVRTGRQL